MPATPDTFNHVEPGASLVTTWSVIAPPGDSARLEQPGARATLTAGPSNLTITGFEQVQVPELVTGRFSAGVADGHGRDLKHGLSPPDQPHRIHGRHHLAGHDTIGTHC